MYSSAQLTHLVMSHKFRKPIDQDRIHQLPKVERFLFLRVSFLVIKLRLCISFFEEALVRALYIDK